MKSIGELADEKLRVKSFNLWELELPMKKPFTASFGSITRRPFLVVEMLSDELGFGEAAVLPEPIYSSEDIETAKHLLSIMLPKVVSLKKASYNDVRAVLSNYRGNNIAKSAIDYAFWYALSKNMNIPLLSIAGPSKSSFKVQESVPIGDLQLISKWVEGAYQRGIKSIKLKIMPGHSWKIAKYIKDNYDPEFISADANASFDHRNRLHQDELHKTAKYVDEIEQPFRPKNLLAHAQLSKSVRTVVSLDESVENIDDAVEYRELVGEKAVINIKPPRLGGLYNSWELAVEMRRGGVECFIGGLLETTLGREFNMAIALMDGVCEKYPADFSPALDFYKDDITKTGFDIENGVVHAPKCENVPFEVDRAKLKKYGRLIASYR